MDPARFISTSGERRPGVQRTVILPSPAAGADWSVNVPGGVSWRVLLATARLSTSVAVANRAPRFHFSDGTNNLGSFEASANVPANTTVTYTFVAGGLGLVQGVTGLFPVIGVPLLVLAAGWQINSITTNLQAADQWSNIFLTIEELYETPSGLSAQAEERQEERVELGAALASGGYPSPGVPALGR